MIGKIAIKLFGSLTEPYLGYFDWLKEELKKARMKPTIHEYLSILIFCSILTFMVSVVVGSVFITFAIFLPGYSYTLSIIVSLVLAGAVFFFGYLYPSLVAKGIRKQIDKALPFAAFYMTTSSASGINPVEIFKVLSLRGGIIGEEAKRIYTNIKTLGVDIGTALQRAASRSPSPAFSDLLWGMTSVITAGGDIEGYLKNKTETLMAQYRRSLTDYAKQITMYTEIYITLVVIGSLFFIILIAIISPMVGISILLLQAFLVFFFIPLISIAFIILLKSISPVE